MYANQKDIDQVELSIEEARKKVERREAALRLAENSDFKELVLDGYCKDEAVRLVNTLNETGFEESQVDINRMLASISDFNRYMRHIVREGRIAKEAIIDHEITLDDLRAEQE